MLKHGDLIFVAHRRLFQSDQVRFFVGQVDEYEAGVVKATGRSYIRDAMVGQVLEKAEKRTKILSLSSGTLIIYQIPEGTRIDALKFVGTEGSLALTDEKDFTMNLSEHTHMGLL
jgi:hypothetical protein